MNNNVPYYSTISRQEIVERIMKYSGGTFDFETFVSKDSREMGDKFLTRSGSAGSSSQAIEGNAPMVVKGSPLKNLKRKVKLSVQTRSDYFIIRKIGIIFQRFITGNRIFHGKLTYRIK